MYFFFNLFFIIFLHYTIKFFFDFNSITFKKITVIYLCYLLIFIFFSFTLNLLDKGNQYHYLCIILNLFIFFCYILGIGLKSIDSPTFYIIEFLKKNKKTNFESIYNNLLNKKLIEIRYKKLEKENLILVNKNFMEITSSGKAFAKFMTFIKIFFNISQEG